MTIFFEMLKSQVCPFLHLGGTLKSQFLFQGVLIFGGFLLPSAVYANITLSAKDARSVNSPAKLIENKKYLTFTEKYKGSVTYEVSVPKAGQYKIKASVIAKGDSENSVYLSVNSGSKITWHFPVSKSLKTSELRKTLSLKQGTNKLVLSGREPDIKLASLELIGEGDSTPTSTPTPTPPPASTPTPTVTPSPTPGATPTPTPKPTVTPTPGSGGSGGSGGTADTGYDPSKAPGTNFDLSLWKITLPVDQNGGTSGVAAEVKSISSSFQEPPFFYTGKDGAMVFSAPTDGATTKGSHYPRSELRELTKSGGNAAWTVAEGGTLSATLAVNQLPVATNGKSRVVIGQIHGPDDELCRLYYDNGVIFFVDDKAGPDLKETQFVLKSSSGATTKIPLNSKFSYTIKATSEKLTLTVEHNGTIYTASEPISSFWPGKALYFKAGVYVQVAKAGSGAGNTGTGFGTVSFYKLSKPTHP